MHIQKKIKRYILLVSKSKKKLFANCKSHGILRVISLSESILLSVEINIKVSASVPLPLMVCSRERSETHFLMNSFSNSILHIYPISQLWPVPNRLFCEFFRKNCRQQLLAKPFLQRISVASGCRHQA